MLQWLFGKKSSSEKTLSAEEISCGDFHLEIVGEYYYQDELRRIAAGRTEKQERVEFKVVLLPEPDNQDDNNAVAVYAAGGSVIGYLSHELAKEYQPAINSFIGATKSHPSCNAVMAGGYGKKSIGVWLDLDTDALLSHA
ncbi:MAG: HIRAN domain-containing protein [Dehalococcoidia bacterium]